MVKCHGNVCYHVHACHTHTGELAGSPGVFFTCPSNGGGNIVIEQWDMYPINGTGVQENIVSRDTMKYDTSTDRLEISNVEPGDEGAYVCTLTVNGSPSMQALGGCLAIYGECFML